MMPKQILLGLTLKHLTGSVEIVPLVHHFGHYASYTSLLELKTAMCRRIDRHTVLPSATDPNRNIVTYLCWNNFDMTEETPSGAGSVKGQ